MKKKLIFISTALWIGGIERALVTLLQGLDPEKYEITLLILRNSMALRAELPPFVKLRCIHREDYPFTWLYRLTEKPTAPSLRHRLLLWAVPVANCLEAALFDRHVRKQLPERFDTAVIYSPAVSRTALHAVRAEKFLLFQHHGVMQPQPGEARAWRKCRWVVAPSEGLAAALRNFRPWYARKVCCIPHLLPGAAVVQKARAYKAEAKDGEFSIVSVGRLHRDKGMDLAVEAAEILRSRGFPFCWYIIGGGWEADALAQQIRALGLEGRVRLTGEMENPYPYMARAQLYVQPSRVEAYGLAIAEARILGRPVLATDTPGARAQLPPECICPATAQAIAGAVAERILSPASPGSLDWQSRNGHTLRQLEALL